ncbi:MAG: arginine--tRNA ligase [Deltaproteobacteria bacterium]|nr:arginine--tRNA ligase [Deltaproteobacteria bacterium]
MKERIRKTIEKTLRELFPEIETSSQTLSKIVVDYPTQERFGDYTTNVAMQYASTLKKNPREIAQALAERLKETQIFTSVEVAGPGFINFTLSPKTWFESLAEVERKGETFGHTQASPSRKIQVEFVSANPTGPLHVGHGRGAAVGDTLARLLRAIGHQVDTEYYINDIGRQMKVLGRSVYLRLLELSGREISFPSDHYQGSYIQDIAKKLLETEGEQLLSIDEDQAVERCREVAAQEILASIRSDLDDFGVRFDRWFSEASLFEKNEVTTALDDLRERGYIVEKDGATWFTSSKFGDEKDRVVIRQNGETTYFASDIAYHWDKFKRGYDLVIDIWGADHHGYIPRMKGVVAALGFDSEQLKVVLIQLVNLLRKGEKVSMSTRGGTFVTLREVLDEVGKDAARYFFLMRRADSPLDFDLDLARQQSNENPVFYVQYAHARISSIEEKAKEAGIPFPRHDQVDWQKFEHPGERRLMKQLARFPEVVTQCAETLEPHRLVYYLHGLSGDFHHYYNHTRVLTDDSELSAARFFLVRCVKQVIRNGLELLGISAPQRM